MKIRIPRFLNLIKEFISHRHAIPRWLNSVINGPEVPTVNSFLLLFKSNHKSLVWSSNHFLVPQTRANRLETHSGRKEQLDNSISTEPLGWDTRNERKEFRNLSTVWLSWKCLVINLWNQHVIGNERKEKLLISAGTHANSRLSGIPGAVIMDEPTWRCRQNPFIRALRIQEPVILREPQIKG